MRRETGAISWRRGAAVAGTGRFFCNLMNVLFFTIYGPLPKDTDRAHEIPPHNAPNILQASAQEWDELVEIKGHTFCSSVS
jgi:hypothetical protein